MCNRNIFLSTNLYNPYGSYKKQETKGNNADLNKKSLSSYSTSAPLSEVKHSCLGSNSLIAWIIKDNQSLFNDKGFFNYFKQELKQKVGNLSEYLLCPTRENLLVYIQKFQASNRDRYVYQTYVDFLVPLLEKEKIDFPLEFLKQTLYIYRPELEMLEKYLKQFLASDSFLPKNIKQDIINKGENYLNLLIKLTTINNLSSVQSILMRLAQTSNNTNHVNNDIDFLLSAFNSISLGESVGTKKNIQRNESDIAAIKEYLPSILQCQITKLNFTQIAALVDAMKKFEISLSD
ncbi:hypothetical protein ACTFIZ_008628 [Dictyostelium cf. discoideum]